MALDNSTEYEAARREIRDNLNEAALSIQAADVQKLTTPQKLTAACENILRAVECVKDATEHIFRVMENEHPGNTLQKYCERRILKQPSESVINKIIGVLLVFERDELEYRKRPRTTQAAEYWAHQWYESVETIYRIVKKHLEAAK